MSTHESRFSRMTAQLIVRKGDAAPSEINRPRRRKTDAPPLSLVTSDFKPKPKPAERWDDQPASGEDTGFAIPSGVFERTLKQSAPKKQHRIMIVLTEEEHETLGIVAVKKGFTRHEMLRKAVDGYLQWLVEEYNTRCRCIASTCSKACDHSSAADDCKRPKDAD